MTPFIMSDEVAEQLRAVARYAEEHRYDERFMRARLATMQAGHPVQPFGEGHRATLPFGFTVVFTIEQHPQHDGSAVWLRHLSIASPAEGRAPHPMAAEYVMGQLGFVGSIRECNAWLEDIGPNQKAVNIIQPVMENTQASEAVN